jgi:hypothetical protein
LLESSYHALEDTVTFCLMHPIAAVALILSSGLMIEDPSWEMWSNQAFGGWWQKCPLGRTFQHATDRNV